MLLFVAKIVTIVLMVSKKNKLKITIKFNVTWSAVCVVKHTESEHVGIQPSLVNRPQRWLQYVCMYNTITQHYGQLSLGNLTFCKIHYLS